MSDIETSIDISHIFGWNGNLTGIERVELNLIKYYFKNTEANFIRWDTEQLCFIDVNRAEVESKIIDRTNKAENSSDTPRDTIRKKIIKRISHRVRQTQGNPTRGQIVVVLAGLWDSQDYIDGLTSLSGHNKLVHVVYDMIPLIHQGYVVDFLPVVFENYMLKILPLCTGILAISKSTAIDTRKILGDRSLPIPDIRTFRLGDDILEKSTTATNRILDYEFILCVGTIEARKNHQILYVLQKKLISEGKKPTTIVFAGKRGWLTTDLQYMIEHDKSLKDSIVILDNTTDNELEWLYENCLYTVTPSYYEGWGLPICESLKYGKVTLSSNISSMPEAGGDYADYFSPYSIDELSLLIEKYSKESERKKREKKIKDSYKLYSWADSSKVFSEKIKLIIGS